MEISIEFDNSHGQPSWVDYAQRFLGSLTSSPVNWNLVTPNVMRIGGSDQNVLMALFALGKSTVKIRNVNYLAPSFRIEGSVHGGGSMGEITADLAFHIDGNAHFLVNTKGALAIAKQLGDLMDTDDEVRFILNRAYYMSANGMDAEKLMRLSRDLCTTLKSHADDEDNTVINKGSSTQIFFADLHKRLIHFIKTKL